MKYGLMGFGSRIYKLATAFALFLFLSPLYGSDRDFTTLFPAKITRVDSYTQYEIEFLDIFPTGLSEFQSISLVGITDVEASFGEEFELFKSQMENVYVYVMFDACAGIFRADGCVQGVILYCEDDELFYGEEDDEDYTGTAETLYELISISCRLVAEGLAVVDSEQEFSPHVQFFLDFTQARRDMEIEKNEKK